MITSYDQFPELKKVILFYKGPLNNSIVSSLGKKIQHHPFLIPLIARKVFAVYMELAENVVHYSDEEKNISVYDEGIGSLCICNQQDCVIISTNNLVKNDEILQIKDQCKIINSLEHYQLRKYKRLQRNKPRFSNSKGAGIGLIHSALIAKSKIDIQINKIDDFFSYLTLTLKVKKE